MTSWTNLNDQTVAVGELQLVGVTNECVNLDPSNNVYYLDSCIAGDQYELFWADPSDSNGDYWLINEFSSDAHGAYYFMTASSYGYTGTVVNDHSGYGDQAIWNFIY